MKSSANPFWTLLAALCVPLAAQAGAAEQAREQCAACHALDAPEPGTRNIDERLTRKAPPLYYAGNKFRREWLESWLRQPARIRPAGVFPPAHAKSTPQGDVIDESTLPAHVALPADEAAAMADFLMQLRPFDDRLAAVRYQPGTISLRMGQMNFSKFKGCDGCHRDAPDVGGVSGPELHSAWKRLQPQFIASFIADPTAWDPNTLMPRMELNDAEVARLADYLKALQEDGS
ncbi:MAG: c-type cytochrome [Pseudomonadota bacterium]|jgi:Cytochrome c.|nr:MAG: cytochrome C [Pseudomonadota bacterium]